MIHIINAMNAFFLVQLRASARLQMLHILTQRALTRLRDVTINAHKSTSNCMKMKIKVVYVQGKELFVHDDNCMKD